MLNPESRMLLPTRIHTRSCATLTTRSTTRFCNRRCAGRVYSAGASLRHPCRIRCPQEVKGPLTCPGASASSFDTANVVVEDEGISGEGESGVKISQMMENPKFRFAAISAGICAASLISLVVFVRSVDDVSGLRMAAVGVGLIGMKFVASMAGLFRKGRWSVFLGLCVKASLAFMLLGSFMMYLEEYFYEFSPQILGIAACTASVLSLLRHVLYTRYGELSDVDKTVVKYVEEIDLENLQSRVALRLSFLSVWLSTTVIFPFLEEILFRGVYVISVAKSGISLEMTAGMSALLFASLRGGSLVEYLFNFLFGGMLAVGFIWSEGNLLLPILIHALVNCVTYCTEYRELLI